MSDHTYQFNVKMHCSGCSGAVQRALGKADGACPPHFRGHYLILSPCFCGMRMTGISSYEVSLEKQEVTVNTARSYEDVLQVISKTGKEVLSGTTIA
ncbi:hypothetical protein DACRYDRAFT_104090 [Dacryopinax primogenitus]|uniref:Uncharacterized protein n=1 Tax=Dacryopinax primogenitus (strain DJM 731) TaxID=1858805 RepID=M5G9W0_DACPD|nr:uncharacterized protein DACRYDRAFT_104090 [Dacryopinax primogenitus]EJU05604.1 hypothetical protein DACRYDRAFT_104090 [Dacryopinax primogenitus]